jgi:hypothetical protein
MPPGLVILTGPASGAGAGRRPAEPAEALLAAALPAGLPTAALAGEALASPPGDSTLAVMADGTVSGPDSGRLREESPTRIW